MNGFDILEDINYTIKAEIKYGLAYMTPHSFTQNSGARITGITPSMLFKHYKLPKDSALCGSGITVGIVTAFGGENVKEEAEKDLAAFSAAFSLPQANTEYICRPPRFCSEHTKKLWQLETALDTQWLHAFAPSAKIRCYLAASDDFSDIFDMLRRADDECDIISLSFGKTEFAGQTEYEDFFENSNALFVCASGNNKKISFPAVCKNVVAVGGTSLYLYADGEAAGPEMPWQESGCGTGKYTEMPLYQQKFKATANPANGKITVPDISFFAHGNRGAAVFCEACGGWTEAVGTSVGAPCIAGICACMAQGNNEVLTKKASLFYELAEKNGIYGEKSPFFDISRGRLYNDGAPYDNTIGFAGKSDICCGLGSPNISQLFKSAGKRQNA